MKLLKAIFPVNVISDIQYRFLSNRVYQGKGPAHIPAHSRGLGVLISALRSDELATHQWAISDYDMASDMGRSHLTALIEALVLYDQLVVNTPLYFGGKPFCDAVNQQYDEQVFCFTEEDEARECEDKAFSIVNGIRSRLVPEVALEDAFHGHGTNSARYLTVDVEYFLPAFLERYGYPTFCTEDGQCEGAWLLQMYFGFVEEQLLSSSLGYPYLPTAYIADQYQEIRHGQYLYLPVVSPQRIVERFARDVAAPVRQRFAKTFSGMDGAGGLAVPLLSQQIVRQAKDTPVIEVIRQVRQSAEAREFRAHVGELNRLFKRRRMHSLERHLQAMDAVAEKWRASFFGPAAMKKKIGVSILGFSGDVEIPDRAVGAWIPKELAFVHRLIADDLFGSR